MGFSKLLIDIQKDVELGVLSFRGIAKKHDVPISWVYESWDLFCEQEDQGLDDSWLTSIYKKQGWYDEQYEIED